MSKIFSILMVFSILFFSFSDSVSAAPFVADASASLKSDAVEGQDPRIETLENYLESHRSPLAEYSGTFIEVADTYNLDWRLIPAITGVESTFGKRIPKNSFNAYGWANGEYRFTSWDESIEVVAKTLREKYIDRGAPTIGRIARRYAPPSSTWAWKVKFFMQKIEPLPIYFDLEG
ncbi:MAG: hypothetical protein UT23_C0016G0014 [Candidatus Woesebacteria bacterium GW2011_GWA1_39_12]|uniref:Mannosyl-glycoprotein endo-beta-N-acetylglucosamidase-like domain-containing protein n=2 Tax=Candidatus Woeseibacteriota TaxID=1752722 RepID=A0A0G0M1N3_9BACT|nr:MAG: hypothetical protein UT23_C0016G0014 [Candidatus Woesebacteria bacterium GW2011_GWA1_39_12]